LMQNPTVLILSVRGRRTVEGRTGADATRAAAFTPAI
jgi:hypothetical protein